MINIALCFFDADGSYHLHAGVTMQSVLANTDQPVCFHIVSKDLPRTSRHNLDKVAEPYGARVLYYDESALDMADVLHFLDKSSYFRRQFSRGAFYRLYLHTLTDLEKVIYLDCDVICNLDIAELYNIDLTGRMCAAVADKGIPKHIEKMQFELGKYVNSGVLLLNLAWLRSNSRLLKSCTEKVLLNGSRFADQDIVNSMARESNYDSVQLLDERFNFISGTWLNDSAFAGKIAHLADRKPWAKWSNSSIQYWKYYRLCPWGQDVFEKMSLLAADLDKLFLQQFSSKERRSLRRFLDLRRLGVLGYFRKRLFKS